MQDRTTRIMPTQERAAVAVDMQKIVMTGAPTVAHPTIALETVAHRQLLIRTIAHYVSCSPTVAHRQLLTDSCSLRKLLTGQMLTAIVAHRQLLTPTVAHRTITHRILDAFRWGCQWFNESLRYYTISTYE